LQNRGFHDTARRFVLKVPHKSVTQGVLDVTFREDDCRVRKAMPPATYRPSASSPSRLCAPIPIIQNSAYAAAANSLTAIQNIGRLSWASTFSDEARPLLMIFA
jgi:hypothetical protein